LFIPYGKGIYGTAIMTELNKRGAVVFVYDERPSLNTLPRIAYRLLKKRMEVFFISYLKNIIKEIGTRDIDYVFIIRAEVFTPKSMCLMRDTFKKAKFILYLWDSVNYTNTVSIFPFFNKVITFDKRDVSRYNLFFRPLFFIDDYRHISSSVERLIDIVFIGKIHSDRYSFLKEFQLLTHSTGINSFFYLYLQSKLLYYKFKLTNSAFRSTKVSDFHYKMLPSNMAALYLSQSVASLDTQHPAQTGLTMRTIEVLGAKRKLITTNVDVADYDFYNSNNVLIIDRNKPLFDIEFLKTPYIELPENIYEKYSLQGWIDNVFL
jgi:hypothetical protein